MLMAGDRLQTWNSLEADDCLLRNAKEVCAAAGRHMRLAGAPTLRMQLPQLSCLWYVHKE